MGNKIQCISLSPNSKIEKWNLKIQNEQEYRIIHVKWINTNCTKNRTNQREISSHHLLSEQLLVVPRNTLLIVIYAGYFHQIHFVKASDQLHHHQKTTEGSELVRKTCHRARGSTCISRQHESIRISNMNEVCRM